MLIGIGYVRMPNSWIMFRNVWKNDFSLGYLLDNLQYNSNMSTFKSPEVHICGRIKTIVDFAKS